MRGVAQHRHAALPPSLEADGLELRPARLVPVRLRGDAGEEVAQPGKGSRPDVRVYRRRLARLVVGQRTQQDVILGVVDRAVEHPAVVRPGLDHHSAGASVLPDFLFRAGDGDPDRAVALPDLMPEQAERGAKRRSRSVGKHDEIAAGPAAVAECDGSVGGDAGDGRIQPDLGTRVGGAAGEQAHDVAPVDAVRAALGLAGQHDIARAVERVAPVDPRASGDHRLGDPERAEDQHHVGLDGDPVALGVDDAAALVKADRPAALRERRRGDESAESAAHDLRVTRPQAVRLARNADRREARSRRPRRRCRRRPG